MKRTKPRKLDSKPIQKEIIQFVLSAITEAPKLEHKLYQLNLETGFGKTEICKKIFEELLLNYRERSSRSFSRVIFTTPRKINLKEMNDFLKDVIKNNPQIPKSAFLFWMAEEECIYNIIGNSHLLFRLKEELEKFKSSCEKQYDQLVTKSKEIYLDTVSDVEAYIEFIQNLSFDNIDGGLTEEETDYIKNLDQRLQRNLYKLFVVHISNYEKERKKEFFKKLGSSVEDKEKNAAFIAEIIKEHLPVCCDIWPQILWREAVVITMTFRKSMSSLKNIIGGERFDYFNECFCSNAVTFRDESDSDIKDAETSYAEMSMKASFDLGKVFKLIGGFFNLNVNTQNNISVKGEALSPEMEKALMDHMEAFNALKDDYVRLRFKYCLNRTIQFQYGTVDTGMAFYRQPGTVLTGVGKEYIYLDTTTSKKGYITLFRNEEGLKNRNIALSDVMVDVNAFFNSLCGFIRRLAVSFKSYSNISSLAKLEKLAQIQNKPLESYFYEEMDDYTALKITVNSIMMGTADENGNIVNALVQNCLLLNSPRPKKKRNNFEIEGGNINHGFSLFTAQKVRYNENAALLLQWVNGVPEADELRLIKLGCVVHISATLRGKTVASNYDYVKLRELGVEIVDISSRPNIKKKINEYKQHINDNFELNDAKYQFYTKYVESIPERTKLEKEETIFKNNISRYQNGENTMELKNVVAELDGICKRSYFNAKKRLNVNSDKYLELLCPKMFNICAALIHFLEIPEMKFFTYIGKTINKSSESFSRTMIDCVVKQYCNILHIDKDTVKVYYIDSSNPKEKTDIIEFLEREKSNKAVIFSNFEYYSRGVNTVYTYNLDDSDENLFSINLNYNVTKRDLDVLYIDDYTYKNLMGGSLGVNDTDKLKEALVTLQTYKRLYDNYEIGKEQFANTFKSLLYAADDNIPYNRSIKVENVRSLVISWALVILQTLGRADRGNIKHKHTTLYLNRNIVAGFPIELFDDLFPGEILKPLQGGLCKYLVESNRDMVSKDWKKARLEEYNRRSLHETRNWLKKIEKMAGREWSVEEVALYENFRNEVLARPFSESIENSICKEVYIDFGENRKSDRYWVRKLKRRNKTAQDIQDEEYTIITDEAERKPKDVCVSMVDSRVNLILGSKIVKNAMVDLKMDVTFRPARYMINFLALKNIYQAVLGEFAGRVILEHFGVKTENISLACYETFDEKVRRSEMHIDYKNWTGFDMSEKTLLNKAMTKMNRAGTQKCIFMNLLWRPEFSCVRACTKLVSGGGNTVLLIPWLYNPENGIYNEESIKIIINEIENDK